MIDYKQEYKKAEATLKRETAKLNKLLEKQDLEKKISTFYKGDIKSLLKDPEKIQNLMQEIIDKNNK